MMANNFPVTGYPFVFQKLHIPGWEKIMNFARESAGKIPYFTHLAWDIAVTENGPVAIEINLSPRYQWTSDLLRRVTGSIRYPLILIITGKTRENDYEIAHIHGCGIIASYSTSQTDTLLNCLW